MNKTITIYELFGMVKNGKAPKKIKYNEETLIIDEYLRICKKDGRPCVCQIDNDFLNETVEIIEDNDKLENIITFYDDNLEEYVAETKINGNKIKEHYGSAFEQMIIDKIKELIDHINKMEKELDKK